MVRLGSFTGRGVVDEISQSLSFGCCRRELTGGHCDVVFGHIKSNKGGLDLGAAARNSEERACKH